MLSDRGVAPFLRAEELEVRWFSGCDWLHLSGYSLLRRPIERGRCEGDRRRQAQGARSASTSPRRAASRLRGRRPSSAGRAPTPTSCSPTRASSRRSARSAPGTRVLKRGATASRRRRRLRGGPRRRRRHDGAGDALAAGYLVGGPELRGRPRRAASPAGSDAVIDLSSSRKSRSVRYRQPVVALETTLVAHGFPAGEGVAVALESERRVGRRARFRPPSASLTGDPRRPRRGPAQPVHAKARKVGPRDLAVCVVQGAIGATTVGGTLAVCRVAGSGSWGRAARRCPPRLGTARRLG